MMEMSMRVRVLAGAAAVSLLAGCATIISGGSDEIRIETADVPGATCEVRSSSGVVLASTVTPGTVSVPRLEERLKVTCEKEGYETGEAELIPKFSRLVWLNFFNFGLGTTVDWLAENRLTFPEGAVVYMEEGDRVAMRRDRSPRRRDDEGAGRSSGGFDTSDAAVYLGFSSSQSQADGTAEFMWLAESDLLGDARPVVQQRIDPGTGLPRFHIFGADLPRFDAEAICEGLEGRGYLCRVVDAQG